MRRGATTAALLGLLWLGALAPAAATATARTVQLPASLAPAGVTKFPQRSYRLTAPARRVLRPQDVTVTENGNPVSRLTLASANGQSPREFGAMLVIDASSSMRGRAIHGALAAARALARQRSGAQQIGVIVFNETPKVLLAPTDDQRAIDEVLARTPALAPQTHIFDAVSTALDLLDQGGITAGSIVLLSDGSDTGSTTAGDAVAARARKANVSIFTVGLRSGAFDSSGLKELAAAAHGRYRPAASVSDVHRILRDLGAQLASDYLIRYRSPSAPGSDVTVAVRVGGVDELATSSYTVPGGATFVLVSDNFWTSGLGLALTALLSAVLLALALWAVLVRRSRGPGLRDRIGGFVSMPDDVSPPTDAVLNGRAATGAERSLERLRWWAGFKRDVEIARLEADPVRIVTVTALATLVLGALLVTITGIPLVGAFALVVPWGVRVFLRVKLERQRTKFTDQLPDMLQGAASAIRAGHGLVAALSLIADDAPEPSRREFLRVVADEGLGVPLEGALGVVQQRMNNREVLQIALVAQIQREAGGNMAEVLDRITDTLRQRGELRRMVKALTAQGRLSRWVVTALPIALLLAITVANPTYVHPLYTTGLGVFMLLVALVMMFLGSVVIGKIVDFKV